MLRCKHNHPTYQKIEKLMAYAQKLGISIDFYGLDTTVTDNDYPGRIYHLKDIENHDEYYQKVVNEIPAIFEYQLIFENEGDTDV